MQGHIYSEIPEPAPEPERSTMTAQSSARNWQGQACPAPDDLKRCVAMAAHGHIVWSTQNGVHQVRYCLQVKQFDDWHKACEEFTNCLAHSGHGMEVIPT